MVSALRLVNTYVARHELRELEERIDGILKDLEEEVNETLTFAFEIGLTNWDLKTASEALEKAGETYNKRVYALLEELPQVALRRDWEALRRELEKVRKKLDEVYETALKLFHALYLATGRREAYDLAVLLYAAWRSLKAGGTAPLYVAAALARYLGRRDAVDAHALAAYGLKGVLPIKKVPTQAPWEAPRIWAAYIRVSYDFEVGRKVLGELLVEWGLLDSLTEKGED